MTSSWCGGLGWVDEEVAAYKLVPMCNGNVTLSSYPVQKISTEKDPGIFLKRARHAFGIPVLIRTAQHHFLSPKVTTSSSPDILFIFNAQHDCATSDENINKASGSRANRDRPVPKRDNRTNEDRHLLNVPALHKMLILFRILVAPISLKSAVKNFVERGQLRHTQIGSSKARRDERKKQRNP
ncbi:hypothetical protein WG66_012673 [Moniliophthora roreri]|nr:hypothetical protein WG66_012673 [Moniliophthora roreri]